MGVGLFLPPYCIRRLIVAQYFKKPNGVIIEATPEHDLTSLKDRFEECDISGKAIKKEAKKSAKKGAK